MQGAQLGLYADLQQHTVVGSSFCSSISALALILTTTPALVNQGKHTDTIILMYSLLCRFCECATDNGGCEQNCNNTIGIQLLHMRYWVPTGQ